jgi:hypothetical protein
MGTQTPSSPNAPPTFPIQEFVTVNPAQITECVNTLVRDINAAILAATGGGGAPGVITRRQLMKAMQNAGVFDVVFQAVIIGSDAWNDFNAAQSLTQSDAIGTLIKNTVPYTPVQLAALWAAAALLPP